LRDVVLVEDVSVVELAKSRGHRRISWVVDVILGSGIADSSTALRIKRGIVGQQSHAHIGIIIVAVDWSIDGLAGQWIER
jgi:hypothetical protein